MVNKNFFFYDNNGGIVQVSMSDFLIDQQYGFLITLKSFQHSSPEIRRCFLLYTFSILFRMKRTRHLERTFVYENGTVLSMNKYLMQKKIDFALGTHTGLLPLAHRTLIYGKVFVFWHLQRFTYSLFYHNIYLLVSYSLGIGIFCTFLRAISMQDYI